MPEGEAADKRSRKGLLQYSSGIHMSIEAWHTPLSISLGSFVGALSVADSRSGASIDMS